MEDGQDSQQTRIFVWAWPRNLSTAVAKCLSCIEDVQMWHEPYTTAYFANIMPKPTLELDSNPITEFWTKAHQAMQDLQKKSHEFSDSSLIPISSFSYRFVKSELEKKEPDKKFIFIKDISFAIMDHFESLPDVPTRHTFLIRHPYRSITSRKNLYLKTTNYQGNPDEFDMIKLSSNIMLSQYERDSMHILWKYVQESGKDPNPIIIDAEEFSNHPDKILPKYLAELGIPFQEKYLTWESSLDPIKKWKGPMEQVAVNYKNGYLGRAIDSSCFVGSPHPTPKREDLTPDIIKMADFILPGYEEMYQKRIKLE